MKGELARIYARVTGSQEVQSRSLSNTVILLIRNSFWKENLLIFEMSESKLMK